MNQEPEYKPNLISKKDETDVSTDDESTDTDDELSDEFDEVDDEQKQPSNWKKKLTIVFAAIVAIVVIWLVTDAVIDRSNRAEITMITPDVVPIESIYFTSSRKTNAHQLTITVIGPAPKGSKEPIVTGFIFGDNLSATTEFHWSPETVIANAGHYEVTISGKNVKTLQKWFEIKEQKKDVPPGDQGGGGGTNPPGSGQGGDPPWLQQKNQADQSVKDAIGT